MDYTKYDHNGYLIVSEMDACPYWEKDDNPCYISCERDCFYCTFSNFRQDNYIQSISGKAKAEPLYGICRNDHNRRKETDNNE